MEEIDPKMVGSPGVTVAGGVVLVLLAVGTGLLGRTLVRRSDDTGRRELVWEVVSNVGPIGFAAVALVYLVQRARTD